MKAIQVVTLTEGRFAILGGVSTKPIRSDWLQQFNIWPETQPWGLEVEASAG
jgi:hypothetical protein